MTFGNNFLLEKIYNSSLFGTGRRQETKFDEIFFGQNLMVQYENEIKNLTFRQLIINGEFLPFNEFEFIAGFRLNRQKYDAIKSCFARAKKNGVFQCWSLLL